MQICVLKNGKMQILSMLELLDVWKAINVEGNPLKVSIKIKAVGAMATTSNDQLLL